MMRSWFVVAASIVTASSICDPNVDQCQISAQPKDNVMLQVGKNRVGKNDEGGPGGGLFGKLKEKKGDGEDDGARGKLAGKLAGREKGAGGKGAGRGGKGAGRGGKGGKRRAGKAGKAKKAGMMKKLKVLSAVKELCFSEADKAKFKLKAKLCGIDLPEKGARAGKGKRGALLEESADCDKDDLKASIKEHIEACDFPEKVKAKLTEKAAECKDPSTDEQKTKCQLLVLKVLKTYKDVCVEGDFEPPPPMKEALHHCAMKHKGVHSDDEHEEHVCDLSKVKEQLKGAIKECGMAEKVKAQAQEAIKEAMEARAKAAGKLKKLKDLKEKK